MASKRSKSRTSAAKSRKKPRVPRGTAIVLGTAKAMPKREQKANTALAIRVLSHDAVIERAVAVRTSFLQAEVNRLTNDVSTLSDRIGRLENPNQPKAGEVGSGTGIFPRPRDRSRARESAIAGRPGTIRDAAAELVAGERARGILPSDLDAARAGQDPYSRTAEELDLIEREAGKRTVVGYTCGCEASFAEGLQPLLRCVVHGSPVRKAADVHRVSAATSFETRQAQREANDARTREVDRVPLGIGSAAEYGPSNETISGGRNRQFQADRFSGIDPPDPNSGNPGPYIQTR